MPTLYGIPNCDKVRAARRWLREHEIDYEFVDYKKTPPTPELLRGFAPAYTPADLLNTRGTTWRRTPENLRPDPEDSEAIINFLCTNPSAIKRPILVHSPDTLVGFDVLKYQGLLL